MTLFDGDPAMAFADLAAELASEIRLLRAMLDELHAHARAREAAYCRVDPDGLAAPYPELGLLALVPVNVGTRTAAVRNPGRWSVREAAQCPSS